MKVYFCKKCNKVISRYSALYGKHYCHSCATRQAFKEGKLNNKGINSGMYGKRLSKKRKQQLKNQMLGKNNPNYKDGRTNKQYFCIDCGIKISGVYFKRCKSCSGKEFSKNIRGIKHWNYKDGKGRLPYPSEFSSHLRKQIRKRDNYTCQVCGMTEVEHLKKYNRVLEVHHIDRNKFNNIEINLKTICKSCHIKIQKRYKIKEK